MLRELCTYCLVVATVGVAPPPVVPPPVGLATSLAGTAVAQMPGASAGTVAATAANAVSNPQFATRLRGQPSVLPTHASWKDTEDTLMESLRSTSPIEAAMLEASYVDQQIPQTSSPTESGVEWLSSLGALMRAALAGAVAAAGGLRLRQQAKMRQQLASMAAAAALTVAPAAAPAIVDYDSVKYLGGSDQVDLNNANVQAYRQFPGMYPTAAGQIATHGPYKQVSDIYNIPGLDDKLKDIMKKYEKNFVALPVNEAYFIDRINNGMYR